MSSIFNLPIHLAETIKEHLTFLYGSDVASTTFDQLEAMLTDFHRRRPHLLTQQGQSRFSEADAILITYGDQIQAPNRPALQVLSETLNRHLKEIINGVHILPFYPYSSDDGFSVIDYTAINPALGSWEDLLPLRQNFRLMFDVVINHISAQSTWFQSFLRGDKPYTDYFIAVDPETDLSTVTRPRTHPLLTPFETASGTKYVWTTFSADQIDLNYRNPAVLLEMINILLFYVSQGAEFIRLDAIGYLWKEIGTTCIHLSQSHRVVQLYRAILDAVAPNVSLITETNVPHAENISYFGDGYNEAQLVYQFSLAPLVLHTFRIGNAEVLQSWATTLDTPSDHTTFFNFIASHDGIGVMPAKGILGEAEILALADQTLAHGGQVSYKTNPDGSQSVYELNITLFDVLSDPNAAEPEALQIDRFIASQAIMLAMAGVPGIYVHSLVGSHNNHAGVAETGRARTINREKWRQDELEAKLAKPDSTAAKIIQHYTPLLKVRAAHPAFHPNGTQQIIRGNPALFALLRTAPDNTEKILCLHNITGQTQEFVTDMATLPVSGEVQDLLSNEVVTVDGQQLKVFLAPYQVRWLLI